MVHVEDRFDIQDTADWCSHDTSWSNFKPVGHITGAFVAYYQYMQSSPANRMSDDYSLVDLDMPPYEWYNKTDYMSNYSVILPFENNWNRLEHYAWHRRYGKSCAYSASVVYVIAVYLLQKVMAHRQHGFELRLPLTIFNFGLAIFSIAGAMRMYGEMYRSIFRHGFVHSVCIASFTQDQVVLRWIKLFGWSKYVELIDTLFLILRKRPVSFLHWYHHASVLVYTWHGMHTLIAAGRWFALMNYAVHSAMYAYFGWRSLGYKCPRWISICITSLQLGQMVVGCVLGYIIHSVKTSGGLCHHAWENLYMAIVIYSTYLYLFIRYFYYAYLSPLPSKKMKMATLLVERNCTNVEKQQKKTA